MDDHPIGLRASRLRSCCHPALLLVLTGTILLLAACGGSKTKPTSAASTHPPAIATVALGALPTGPAAQTRIAGEVAQGQTIATALAHFKPSIAVCSLVGRTEAERILGIKLTTDPEPMPQEMKCAYETSTTTILLSAGTAKDLATLMALTGESTDLNTFWRQRQQAAKGQDGYQTVDGLGDAAFATTDGGVVVRAGNTLVQVDGGTLAQEKAFAKAALSHLGKT